MCHIFVQTHPHCTMYMYTYPAYFCRVLVAFWSSQTRALSTSAFDISHTHTCQKRFLRFSFLTSSFGSMITIGSGW